MYALALSRVWSAAPAVDATIEPAQISVGESAQLTVMASGSGTLSVPLPVVSGLEFRVGGQSRRVQIINGAAISSTSTIIRVTAEVPGIFTIPGVTPNSPSLVLRVNPAGSSSNSALLPPGNAPLLPGGSLPNGIRLSPDGSAFIRLELPKRDIFVGESIPVEIQVGMRQGFAGINGLPTLNSSDFTLNNLSQQPEQSERTIDRKPFTVVTWRSLIAAVKPGAYSLTVEAPLRVRIRTQPERDSLLDDLLGDPFMQNFFGASVMKDIVVASPPAALTVLALPTEGRPKDFSGAVGEFKIASDVSSPTATAGDPLSVRMHVTGNGNFDRVDSPMLSGDSQWKTYLPKATFKSADPTGYKGDKIFEQPLIATRPGTQTIPPLSFSFFDPTTRRYQTARSSPLKVTILPSVADTAPGSDPAAAGPRTQSSATAPDALRPDHPARGPLVGSLVPLYFQPRFLLIPSFVGLLFAGAWLTQWRRDRRADVARLGNEQAKAKRDAVVKQMQSAVGDAALFFNSARAALQQTLGTRWQLAPDEVSVAEIDSRLGPDGADIRQLFALADEANYSGHQLKAPDFERWIQTVRRHMTQESAS
ncbi:MAG: BatD family protein [Pseudomonadota bacterium]|nr:BatD family protein [Pseudomonadota bacterium]